MHTKSRHNTEYINLTKAPSKQDLQALTASEPLSIEEEYAMQQSWRADNDKLTFIACLPPSTSTPSATIKAKEDDTSSRMIGDINLFLNHDDDTASDDEINSPTKSTNPSLNTKTPTRKVIGEIELMIAEKHLHRQGYGRSALHAFLQYILSNAHAILAEYVGPASATEEAFSTTTKTTLDGGLGVASVTNATDTNATTTVESASGAKEEGMGEAEGEEKARLEYLRVKISQENEPSIALFESVGFVRTAAEANFFGEVELRLLVAGLVGPTGKEVVERLRERCNGKSGNANKRWEEIEVKRYE